ncbi:E3 ubiquitin-protein ligase Mdm2 [Trichomycterus rosablanca]|uniref:E3 ubiquitin-protein ligase Mdm2 n=1 Tax=Trichomycterus rosablanca TaxID=2290929 RepID=UPI002F3520A7
MAAENCLSSSQINKIDNEKLVRPKVQLQALLKDAGADKEVFTMKEVMFYLGKYIMCKELYDKQQQHIVHCENDPLGAVLGVASFSVKEPRMLFAMISKNLTAVKNPDSPTNLADPRSQSEHDRGPEETNSDSSTSAQQQQQRRRRRSSSDPASFSGLEDSGEPRKRHKSDSISLTFDDSLSWCVIGGLRRDRGSSESSVSHSSVNEGRSHGEGSEDSDDSESDNFSVEFEVESIDSDEYSEIDEDSVPEDEVYEVTIFADNEDSFDEDTEITEDDYWKCSECEVLNPPLPRHCKSCWKVRAGWLPESRAQPDAQTNTSCHSTDLECAPETKARPDSPDEGVDVPDGKSSRSQTAGSSDSQGSSLSCSQPSTSSSQEDAPELERLNSLNSLSGSEISLPSSCLEPCVICQSRPKNGCIVHGRTGHLMACYTCARKLKSRNKLCPVCREPIQSVVLTYVS